MLIITDDFDDEDVMSEPGGKSVPREPSGHPL